MWIILFLLAVLLIWFGSTQIKSYFSADESGELSPETKELLNAASKISRIEHMLSAGIGALVFLGLLGFWLLKGIAWRWPEMSNELYTAIRFSVFVGMILLVVPVFNTIMHKKGVGNFIGLLIMMGLIGIAVEGLLEGVFFNGN